MRKIGMVLTWLVCAGLAQAADYPYLVFTNTAGTNTVMNVSSLTIRVSGNSLQVTNSEGTESFTLTDLASMQFSKDGSTSAIENVLDADGEVDVFAVNGVKLGSFSSLTEAARSLCAGAYVIKQGGKAQTIVVR
jgi:hypothetical protein